MTDTEKLDFVLRAIEPALRRAEITWNGSSAHGSTEADAVGEFERGSGASFERVPDTDMLTLIQAEIARHPGMPAVDAVWLRMWVLPALKQRLRAWVPGSPATRNVLK